MQPYFCLPVHLQRLYNMMSCWLLNKRYEFKTWFRTPNRSIRSSSPNKTTNRMKYSMLNYYLLFAKRSIYIVVPHHPLAHVCIAFKLRRARARAFMQRIYCSAPAYKNARAGKGTRAYTDTSSTFVCAFFFVLSEAHHTRTPPAYVPSRFLSFMRE